MHLPPRPLRLQSSFLWKRWLGGALLLLVGLGAGGGYAWWQLGAASELREQMKIWNEGVPSDQGEVDGKVTTRKFLFHDYDLEVRYVDKAGAEHKGKLEFDTVLSEVDQSKDPEVRYLAADPTRFAVSWATDMSTNRWVNVIVFLVLGVGLIGGCFLFLGAATLRALFDASRVARESEELQLDIAQISQQVVNGQHTGNTFNYKGRAADGREISGSTVFNLKHHPLYGDPDQRTLVGLVSPEVPNRVVVIRDDFYPFDFSPEQQEEIRRSIARKGPLS